jgi:hypothetical protein
MPRFTSTSARTTISCATTKQGNFPTRKFSDPDSARQEAIETGATIARDTFILGGTHHVVIDVRQDDAPFLTVSITMDVEEKAE